MVSTSGGNEPVWSQSSRELFYRNMQGDMVTVPVEVEPTFAPGQPEVLRGTQGSGAELVLDPTREPFL